MTNRALLFVLIAIMLRSATVQAAPANPPETGQTTCTDTTGIVIDCAGTGQDGDLKAGVAWPSPRFAAGSGVEAECVTDKLTGLMWVRVPTAVADTWANALNNANSLTLCGFSDWRLPNVYELESLRNSESATSTFLNAQGFSGVSAGVYWSSTSWPGNAVYAWAVYLDDGYVFTLVKTDSYYIWPVRAGL